MKRIILLLLVLTSCSKRVYVQKGYSEKILYVCNNGFTKSLYFDNFEICNYTGNAIVGDSVSVIYSTDRWSQNNFLNEIQ